MLAPMSAPLPPSGGDSGDEPPGDKTFVDPNVYDGKWDESTVDERGGRRAAEAGEAGSAPARGARLRVTGGGDPGRGFLSREAGTSGRPGPHQRHILLRPPGA